MAMQARIEQLSQIIILAGLEKQDRINLQPHTKVQRYSKAEIMLHEGDRLPANSNLCFVYASTNRARSCIKS